MGITKEVLSGVDDGAQKALQNVDAKKAQVFRFGVKNCSVVAVQITLKETAGSGARSVWNVQGSLDGNGFADLATPQTITVIDGTVIIRGIDVTNEAAIQITNSAGKSSYTTEMVDIVVMRGEWT